MPRPGAFTEFILEIGGKPEIERYPGHEAIHLMLLVDRLLDDGPPTWTETLSSSLNSYRASVTADRNARSGEYWFNYGQLTQTGSHSAETILHRHRFFTEKILGLLTPRRVAV